MTKQIEQAYRNNRRRSWLLIAAVVALAVVAIPIASGASEKNYTLAYAVATQQSPSPALTRAALCTSTPDQTVTVYLTNTAKSASLGSAEIALPTYATGATAFKKVTPTSTEAAVSGSDLTYNQATDKLTLKNLGLAKYGSVRLVVAVNPTSVDSPSSPNIGAIVKQSNEFNDSSGDANLFANPAFPTLTVQNCLGKISGQVWNDQNENKARNAADSVFEVAQNTWFVRLYKKVNGVYASTPVRTSPNTFDANGVYTFEDVPLYSSYLVCEEASSTDATKEWHQTTDTNNSAACSVLNTSNEKNGWEIAQFAADVSGRDFGNARSTTVATCGGSAASNLSFTVAGGTGGNCKAAGPEFAEYVYEKWTDGGIQYAAFHPVSGDGVCDLTVSTPGACTYFVQKLTWVFQGTAQPDPADRSLNYDDKKNVNLQYELEPMKYCKKDPRASGSELGLAVLGSPADVALNVLPSNVPPRADGDLQSSCLITSSESTTATTGEIRRVDYVLTAVDGRSNIG